ncbi:Arabinose operon regulatory protein [compost metagenome]
MAERLYVNPSYLSRLFKREMGVVFSSYVLKRRMELAKELLSTGMKVYDAAYASGYRDVTYFAKIFRKYWGVAPSEMKG